MRVADRRQRVLQATGLAQDGPPIVAGDVLVVQGHGGFADIGTHGGLMGHVVLALAAPQRLAATGYEATELLKMWPSLDTSHVWLLQTIESARGKTGLHRSTLLLYLEARSMRFVLVGEMPDDTETLFIIEKELVTIWQSPPDFRSRIRHEDVATILDEMCGMEQNWSLATAARALVSSAEVRPPARGLRSGDRSRILQELQGCWEEAPICTSVVIVFWQRLLCKFAQATGQDELELILRWLPLKADRGLPGDLIGTMQRNGWTTNQQLVVSL